MRLLTTIVAAALMLPAAAFAQSPTAALIKDCQDEKIDGTYTAAEYRDALRRLPTDVDEYTNCRVILRSAQLRVAGLRSAPAGGGAALAARSVGRPVPGDGPPGTPLTSAAQAPAGAPGPVAGALRGRAVTAPSPVPGLPAGGPPGAAPPVAPVVPVSAATGAGDDVPPTLAVVLVVLAAGLLVAAAISRRVRSG